MMTNLFSIFDPSLGLGGSFLPTFFVVVLFIPGLYWSSSYYGYSLNSLYNSFLLEVSYSLSHIQKGLLKTFFTVFFFVFLMNFLSLFPFIFSMTSHMSVTLPLSYSFWLMVVLFFWFRFINNFLSHLIPVGTPVGLMSFMVIVELLSNFIRPVALTFRLTANMMAGHLLMSLIGGFLINLSFSFTVLGSSLQIMLVFMELGVSFIQSYVFCTLLILYTSEIVSH